MGVQQLQLLNEILTILYLCAAKYGVMKKCLLFVIFVLVCLSSNAVNVEIDGIRYNLDLKKGVAEVTTNPNKVYADSIVIPEKIVYEGSQYPVTSIGEKAFFCCDKVLAVTFPQSISSIGHAAFWGCHAIDSIALPELLTVIEYDLFADCQGLRRVTIPDGVTTIGNSAFNSCVRLDSLVLPNNVTTIEDWAFAGCSSLSYIEIPRSLNVVGRGAFGNCPALMSVKISDLSSWCMINFADDNANPLRNSHKLIVNGEEITDLVIPDDVSYIGNYAFYPCKNITSLTIGEQITRIGALAFYQCSNLTSVTCYPRKVPYTGNNVFNKEAIENAILYVASSAANAYKNTQPWSGFKEIVSLDIPKHQLSYYVDAALYKSYMLEEGEYITVEPAPKKEGYTFSGWSEIPEKMPKHDVTVTGTFTLTSKQLLLDGIRYTLWVKEKTAEVIGSAFDEDDSASHNLSIPSVVSKDDEDYLVTRISDSAFKNCLNMVSVIIPASVNSIGANAFEGCKLQNVFIKNIRTQFEYSSFSQASYNHTMLYIPIGKWQDAVYEGLWWRFINIRETATETEELSPTQAYTMMDTKTFGYIVYDVVNDEVKTVNSFYAIDESSPYNSWQMVNTGGNYCLYNIGAKKYAYLSPDGRFSLSLTPQALKMDNKQDGIVIENNTQAEWNFVLNNKVSIDQNILGIAPVLENVSNTISNYYLPSGIKMSTPQKGVVIIRLKDGRTKKIIQ